uniref:Uncharacterized protein n=1 Tax=Rhizophora mucronata TaxID=61149 RepID=A0A2P2IVF5_RHIMU
MEVKTVLFELFGISVKLIKEIASNPHIIYIIKIRINMMRRGSNTIAPFINSFPRRFCFHLPVQSLPHPH